MPFDPVFGYLVNRVADKTTVCCRDDAIGVIGGLRQASLWFEFSVEKFVEGFVAAEVFDEEFVGGDAVLFDEVWLPLSIREIRGLQFSRLIQDCQSVFLLQEIPL